MSKPKVYLDQRQPGGRSNGRIYRDRAAYILRAGRSRGRGNVVRIKKYGKYFIKDCDSYISIIS